MWATAAEPLLPVRCDFPFVPYPPEVLDRYRDAVLAVLARTGVRVDSERARAVFAEHGARPDPATGVVRLEPGFVLEALSRAPRRFTLGSREGDCDLDLQPGVTWNTTNGCGSEVLDWRSGVRRPSTRDDLAAITRAVDFLGSVQFWWPTVAATDCGVTHALHELEVGWTNTVKHLQGMVQGEEQARLAVEMARAVAGSEERLRRRPPLSALIGTVQPLVLDRDGTDAALVFAAAGVPVCFVSMPTYGTTAPATRAGAIVMGVAEMVAGAVLLQLASPGAPVLLFPLPVHADPRTAAVLTAPLDHRGLCLGPALVHHFGLPAMTGYAGTDDERAGTWLAAAETAHTVMLSALFGAELMTTIGLTATYQLFVAEHLLLDDDIYRRAAWVLRDLPLDDEELALDVIDEVGPGGHFLGHRHTRRHMKETVVRSIGQQFGPDGAAFRDPVEVARERALVLLEEYEPRPLDDDVARELRRIVAHADATLTG